MDFYILETVLSISDIYGCSIYLLVLIIAIYQNEEELKVGHLIYRKENAKGVIYCR